MSGSKVLASSQNYASRVALEASGQQWTYAALTQAVALTQELLQDAKRIALMMDNSPAWVIMDLACIAADLPLLPLPGFFSEKQIRHALSEAGIDTIFTDQPERFGGYASKVSIAGQTYHRIKLAHTEKPLPPHTAKITFTSGTTDEPKGVCLTQEAMETVATSLLSMIKAPPTARHVCVLPLGVLLENVAGVYTALLAGATICLPPVQHEPKALYAALQHYQATSCILVPELFRMLLAVAKPLPLLTYIAVGGARVAPELLQLAKFAGIPVYEGYGLSEASSVVAVNTPEAHKIGSVGKLLSHVKMRREKDGELFIHRALFSGYLGDTALSEEWYATGDIGHIDGDGFLFIDGRKKNIYITSHGRNVSPEWIESLLTAHPAITQAVVFGEAKSFSVAIIVSSYPQSISGVLHYINQQLPDYARVGTHILASEPFTVANGQLTGTGRPRRQVIHDHYANEIEACYAQELYA